MENGHKIGAHDGTITVVDDSQLRRSDVAKVIRQRRIDCEFTRDRILEDQVQVDAGTAGARTTENLQLFNRLPAIDQNMVKEGVARITYDIAGQRVVTPIVKKQ